MLSLHQPTPSWDSWEVRPKKVVTTLVGLARTELTARLLIVDKYVCWD